MAVSLSPSRALCTANTSRLDHLAHRFAEFRRTHSKHARIPDSLRRAVLMALNAGLSSGEVCRACRITQTQIHYWQFHQGRKREAADVQLTPQVFPVVHDITPMEHDGWPHSDALELRCGPWSICIRPIQG